jgi:hypothetical protein
MSGKTYVCVYEGKSLPLHFDITAAGLQPNRCDALGFAVYKLWPRRHQIFRVYIGRGDEELASVFRSGDQDCLIPKATDDPNLDSFMLGWRKWFVQCEDENDEAAAKYRALKKKIDATRELTTQCKSAETRLAEVDRELDRLQAEKAELVEKLPRSLELLEAMTKDLLRDDTVKDTATKQPAAIIGRLCDRHHSMYCGCTSS